MGTRPCEYDWKPTGSFSLAGVVQRDIFPYQDIGSSFVARERVLLRRRSADGKIDVSGSSFTASGSSWASGTAVRVSSNEPTGCARRLRRFRTRPARIFALQLRPSARPLFKRCP